MKTLSIFIVGAASGLTNVVSTAQTGNMMDGSGMWSGWMGGYGMSWLPILLVCIVLVGLVIWVIIQKRK